MMGSVMGGVPAYAVCMGLAGLTAFAVLAALLRRRGIDRGAAVDLGILLTVSYTAGARVLHAVVKGGPLLADGSQGGYWGGQLAFAAVAGVYLLLARRPRAPLADALAVAWAAASVPVKAGCAISGCCGAGERVSVPWIDAAAAAVLFAGLLGLHGTGRAPGRLLLLWGLGYAALKCATESLRSDLARPVLDVGSLSQAIEVAVAAGCAVVLWRPGAWDRFLAGGRARMNPPGPAASRRRSVAVASALAAAALALGWWAGPAGYVLVHLAAAAGLNTAAGARMAGYRVVDADGRPAAGARLFVRAVGELLAPLTGLGLARPLVDGRGRSLGDAWAGTFAVEVRKGC